uniref:THAP-type domain-containing protein n=1 Tax=Erpetoichthys calabaricus TaxID=27687 RepID=A0A8C4XC74_ERPCA
MVIQNNSGITCSVSLCSISNEKQSYRIFHIIKIYEGPDNVICCGTMYVCSQHFKSDVYMKLKERGAISTIHCWLTNRKQDYQSTCHFQILGKGKI